MTNKIKNLTLENLEEVSHICKQQFNEHSWSYNQIKDALNDINYIKIGIFENNSLCSFCFALCSFDDINILVVATENTSKNKGFAKMLIKEIIEQAKQKNKTISLEVREDNVVAINLYKCMGFSTEYVRKAYYKDKTNALIMFIR